MKSTCDFFDSAYSELKLLARQLMLHERNNHTLSATALVNEAFVRLESSKCLPTWSSRAHFLAAASRAMRRVLIDHARAKSRNKRAGVRAGIEVDQLEKIDSVDWDWLLDVDHAIEQLSVDDPLAAEFARLRLYGGQSVVDAGVLLGLRKTAAYQMWDFIESWFAVYRDEGEKGV